MDILSPELLLHMAAIDAALKKAQAEHKSRTRYTAAREIGMDDQQHKALASCPS